MDGFDDTTGFGDCMAIAGGVSM